MFQSEESESDIKSNQEKYLKEQEKIVSRRIMYGIIGLSVGLTLLILFAEYLKTHP